MNALDPAGPQAAYVTGLWWFLLVTSAIVWLLVVIALGVAVFHRRHDGRRPEDATRRERRAVAAIVIATASTIATLFAFLIIDLGVSRAMASMPDDGELIIEVTGFQWWWQVRYKDSISSRNLITANEIRIPVGRPVRLEMTSRDVIHSFWVPRLQGKRDMIPGRRSSLRIRADSAGTYRGQCAEFCGHQHAKMAFTVIAQPAAEFAAWWDAQLQPAREPVTAAEHRGRTVFLAGQCALCHTIRGTDAGGTVGPDLTHIASRGSIAAGTLPNTRGHLAGWIVDPQSVKPGAKMPPNSLAPSDLDALLSYLESLR